MSAIYDPPTFIGPCPDGLEEQYNALFSEKAIQFVTQLVSVFDSQFESLSWNRYMRKYHYQRSKILPKFKDSPERKDKKWKIAPLPERLQNRHLDLGDVSPANSEHFMKALNAEVKGIQVDFDDGHCPTWKNQLLGLHNVCKVVHGQFVDLPSLNSLPVLMFRPRAWNIIEHNMMVNGKEVPGALFDFGFLIFHNAIKLAETKCGPFLYLSKLEGEEEAKLWNEIFKWTQEQLGLPYGTIKACILIENILSSFELDEILFAIKDHSLGLNCGIWDYSASIISKFGCRQSFMMPDRNKYVNMSQHFLQSYMSLVIQTCHEHGAHATGGMAAQLLSQEDDSRNNQIIQDVCDAKHQEIVTGVDGFLVYDVRLVPYMNEIWAKHTHQPNQFSVLPNKIIQSIELLQMPSGEVTRSGLIHNVEVAILFIYHWFEGKGHFEYKGAVEDSATAEISRSQVWQWIRHKAITEDKTLVTKLLVTQIANDFVMECKDKKLFGLSLNTSQRMKVAKQVYLELVSTRNFPDFITTYLNDSYIFRYYQDQTE